MRQTIGFLFFMLFLAGLAFAMLKNLRSAESDRQDTGAAQTPITIISGRWKVGSTEFVDGRTVFVRFGQDGEVSGFAGCNRFFGTFLATDTTLDVSALGATRMSCPGESMQQEMAFLRAVESAAAYSIAGRTLTLDPGGGEPTQLQLAEDIIP